MKWFLIALSGVTTLVLATNTNIKNTNLIINKSLQKTTVNESARSLFNYKYGYLSDSNIITTQATSDHKFYSYDTSALEAYTFADKQDVFLVDSTTGDLVYNKDVTIPDNEKSDIENTRQEMISARKITTIKDDYDPYSKSEYNKTYFAGDYHDWQYLQLGGLASHINISSQTHGNKVEHNDSLSEAWVLYYIAKAERNGQIDQSVADNLATYFMSQTTIKDSFNNDLTSIIINAISKNTNIFRFLQDTPLSVTAKNNSLNYIFDKDNKLIEVYYHTWANNNIDQDDMHYSYSDSYSWFGSDSSNQYVLLKWSNYAKNWDTFINKYSTFNFNNNSYLKMVLTNDHTANTNFPSSEQTKNIKTNQGSGNTNSLYNLSLAYHFGRYSYNATFDLNIWHDNDNIYFRWFFNHNGNTTLDVKLNNVIFFNVMN